MGLSRDKSLQLDDLLNRVDTRAMRMIPCTLPAPRQSFRNRGCDRFVSLRPCELAKNRYHRRLRSRAKRHLPAWAIDQVLPDTAECRRRQAMPDQPGHNRQRDANKDGPGCQTQFVTVRMSNPLPPSRLVILPKIPWGVDSGWRLSTD